MLSVSNLSKSFDLQLILDSVNFTLNPGECWGLVGPNGCGKTTLLRIIAGLEQADRGSVRFDPPDLRLGYLSQGFEPVPGETLAGFLTRMEGDIPALSARLEDLARALAQQPNQPALQRQYDSTLAQIERAAQSAGRGESTLAALGLQHIPADLPVSALSGGQKTRLALAGMLLSAPQLLLLDEPTNHLDLPMLGWLEDWLADFSGGVLVVSHDRAFLDGVAAGIFEIDDFTHRLRAYPGNYSDYVEAKAAERARHWQAYGDQQEEIARLKSAARHVRSLAQFRKGGKADGGDKFAKGFFANRGLETTRRAKSIERRIDRLLTSDHVEKPKLTWEMKIEFGESGETGRDVAVMQGLAVGYNGQALLSEINLTLRHGERAALIGPNGSGKTTLLRTLSGILPPVSGTARLGSRVKAGTMRQEQEELDPSLNPLTTIQQFAFASPTEARSFLSLYLFKGDDVFTPVGKLSFGERARLSLACLVAQGCNLLLLDEPVNHLDIPSRARFEQALAGFEGTILAVTHDRYFIQSFANVVWQVQDGTIKEVERR